MTRNGRRNRLPVSVNEEIEHALGHARPLQEGAGAAPRYRACRRGVRSRAPKCAGLNLVGDDGATVHLLGHARRRRARRTPPSPGSETRPFGCRVAAANTGADSKAADDRNTFDLRELLERSAVRLSSPGRRSASLAGSTTMSSSPQAARTVPTLGLVVVQDRDRASSRAADGGGAPSPPVRPSLPAPSTTTSSPQNSRAAKRLRRMPRATGTPTRRAEPAEKPRVRGDPRDGRADVEQRGSPQAEVRERGPDAEGCGAPSERSAASSSEVDREVRRETSRTRIPTPNRLGHGAPPCALTKSEQAPKPAATKSAPAEEERSGAPGGR